MALAVKRAGLTLGEIDGIAAAAGRVWWACVMVGLTAGKALALALGKPFIAVNHLEAHALTARLDRCVAFPYLLLLSRAAHPAYRGARRRPYPPWRHD